MPEQAASSPVALATGDRVVIGGASGFIGRALVRSLRASGVQVSRLTRSSESAHGATAADSDARGDIPWRPGHPDGLDPAALEGARAVIILNGLSIGRIPYPRGYRTDLVSSRLDPQHTLASALAKMTGPRPPVLIASATGIYGSTPEIVDESSTVAGSGFLAQLAVKLEHASQASVDAGADVTLLRIAPIVHPDAVLGPMVLLTKLGLAGPLGGGRQVWSWASLPDTIAGIRHCIEHRLTGPVNLNGPTRATQNDLGFALARELNRPYLLRAPAWALRLALRDLADELLLTDAEVRPTRLIESGFRWRQRTVEQAVRLAIRG